MSSMFNWAKLAVNHSSMTKSIEYNISHLPEKSEFISSRNRCDSSELVGLRRL
jgi:hypothetical protein